MVSDRRFYIVPALDELRQLYDYVLTTGGIGPTHDDITAECVAETFQVSLDSHPEIEARIRSRKTSPEILKNRLRMAMVPSGAKLIENLTGGPQGFSLDNVYCMAGIPSVLESMLQTIQFKGGPLTHTFSLTVHVGETHVSSQFAAIQEQFDEHVEIGSYPFLRDGTYGTTVVLRGTDKQKLQQALNRLQVELEQLGVEALDIQRSAPSAPFAP